MPGHRLNDALRRTNPKFNPVFIGTSATLQAGEDTDPKAGVAQFFARLTGQETPPEAIITEVTKTPPLPAGLNLPPAPMINADFRGRENNQSFWGRRPRFLGDLAISMLGSLIVY